MGEYCQDSRLKQLQQAGCLGFDERFAKPAQPADELQIFEPGEVGVEMRFFRHVAESAAKRDHVVANVVAFEEHMSVVGPQHAGNDFDGGRFARAVGAEEADDLAGATP